MHPRAKMLLSALVGAITALVLSTLGGNLAEKLSAPDRAKIVPVGSATLVRETEKTTDDLDSSTRLSEATPGNGVVMSVAREEIALESVPVEDRPRFQARQEEDRAIAERELLEGKKRAIERQIQDAHTAEQRRNEDKEIDERRDADRKRREEGRAQEDKKIIEQRRAEAEVTTSLTAAETP